MIQVVERLAHGIELMDLKDTIAADIAEQGENRFIDLLAQVFNQAKVRGELNFDRVGLAATDCAELLVLAVSGMKQPPCRLEPYLQRLLRLVRIFYAALASKQI